MNKLFLVLGLTFSYLGVALAQTSLIGDAEEKVIDIPKNGVRTKAIVVDGDTMAVGYLHEVLIVDDRVFKSKEEQNKHRRLIRNVKKVYPYARLAGEKLKQYEAMLAGIQTDAEKKRIMKRIEADLKSEYKDELENLTVDQGKILLKLIDRETGDTSYELVKELRGSLSAFFWQSLARLFGSDLKAEYDAEGNDKKIEEIVLLIQKGKI